MPHTLNRVVKIAVDVVASPDGKVDIICTPEQADVAKDTSHVLLVFTLKTTGFRFPLDHAIIIDPQQAAAAEAKTNFPFASWTISDSQAALFDTNRTAQPFAYTVNVINNSTGVPYNIDPVINNGGGGIGMGDC